MECSFTVAILDFLMVLDSMCQCLIRERKDSDLIMLLTKGNG